MIKPSEHGFIIRRETNPRMRSMGGPYRMDPAPPNTSLTLEMLEMGRRIFGGLEEVDKNDPGWQA